MIVYSFLHPDQKYQIDVELKAEAVGWEKNS